MTIRFPWQLISALAYCGLAWTVESYRSTGDKGWIMGITAFVMIMACTFYWAGMKVGDKR